MNSITVSAPGRIDLSGGATDWCGMHTLALAINLRAYASVTLLKDEEKIEISIDNLHEEYYEPTYGTALDLFKACIELTGLSGFKVEYKTDIPKGSGLGGSAPLTVSTVYALNELFEKYWSRYYIAELAQRAETLKLKTVQGYQDQYSASFGGLIFMDFEGKEHKADSYQRPIEEEPYTVVEDLSSYLPDFHVIVVVPQIDRSSSNQTNASLSDRYLNGEKEVVNAMKRKARYTQEAKKELIEGRMKNFYHLMNKNNEIMEGWGFLSKYNKRVLDIANSHKAEAVKTCGAGRAAMAIFARDENHQEELYRVLEHEVEHIFKVKMDEGARIEK